MMFTGRLGLGNQECMASPQPVPVSEDVRPCSVYCGVDCSVILTLDGTLLCCGNNRLVTAFFFDIAILSIKIQIIIDFDITYG